MSSMRRVARGPFQLAALAATALLVACAEAELPLTPEATPSLSEPALSLVATTTVELEPIVVTELSHEVYPGPGNTTVVENRFMVAQESEPISVTEGGYVTVRLEAPPEHTFVLRPAEGYLTNELIIILDWRKATSDLAYGPNITFSFDDAAVGEAPTGYTAIGDDGTEIPVDNRVGSGTAWFEIELRLAVNGLFEFTTLDLSFPLSAGAVEGSYTRSGSVRGEAQVPGELPDPGPVLSLRDLRSPALRIENLILLVAGMNLPKGIDTALIAKLDAALAAVTAANADQRADAARHLIAFVHAVEAQAGKKLTIEQASVLSDAAAAIIADLEP